MSEKITEARPVSSTVINTVTDSGMEKSYTRYSASTWVENHYETELWIPESDILILEKLFQSYQQKTELK